MGVFGRLVVGTDGSDSAHRAVEHAALLGGRIDAEVVVAHAYASARAQRTGLQDAYPARDIGASILRDVGTAFGGSVRVRPALLEGDAVDGLVRVATEEEGDLIVVGNRGMGRRLTLIGAVGARVAHRAPCSVLIADTTGRVHAEPYRRILIGTDGSPTAARAAGVALELARDVEAESLLVHVGDPVHGRRALEDTLRSAGGGEPTTTATVEGDPAAALVEVAGAEECDLIVVGNRGMTGTRRFLSSVPNRVAHHAPCHALLVKTT